MSKLKSQTIVFSKINYVEGSDSTFVYKLKTPVDLKAEDTLSIQETSIYNSFFNIEQRRDNNQFQIVWNADTSTTYTVSIDDSYLEIDDIDNLIKAFCIENKLYMNETATGKAIVLISLSIVPSRYKSELRITPLPTQAEADILGYTKAENANWNFPTIAKVPQLKIIDNNFGTLIGFNRDQLIPDTINDTYTQIISDFVPQIVPLSNIQMGCNLIRNQYTLPNNIFTSLPMNAKFGHLIFFQNGSGNYSNIAPGTYTEFEIRFYDQHNKPLQILDKNISILLNIKQTY